MSDLAPFWSAATLISDSTQPGDFQVSLEDIVSGTGRLLEGELSSYSAKGTPFTEGDVLFGKLRPYLAKYWLADRAGTAGGDIHVYRPTDATDPRFLQYAVGSENFIKFADASSKGTKMPRAEWASLREFRIAQYSLETQRRIADYLDRETSQIDAMIDKLDELDEILGARRQSVIDEVFLQTSKFAPLWTLTKDVIDCPHTTPVADDLGQYEAVRTASVRGGKYLPGNGISVSETTARERNGENGPDPGDVFFTREAPAGEACIVPEGNFCLGQRMVLIKPDFEKLDSRFLIYAIYASNNKSEMALSAGGTTVVNLKLGTIRSMKIPAYDLEEQRRIADHLDDVTSKIDAMLAKVAELKDLLTERRAALITDVVTGRKEVA